jgi:hypothetical protein
MPQPGEAWAMRDSSVNYWLDRIGQIETTASFKLDTLLMGMREDRYARADGECPGLTHTVYDERCRCHDRW